MRRLVSTPKFEKAYRIFLRRHPSLQKRIDATLVKMEQDVFAPDLETHKLSGKLFGLSACSCGYDCRIVFSIQKEPNTDQECLVLIAIGTHDEVY
jgi:mRNA interferase YafQ